MVFNRSNDVHLYVQACVRVPASAFHAASSVVFHAACGCADAVKLWSCRRIVSTHSIRTLESTRLQPNLYDLTAYTVTRRTREIGIRMALGADRRNILWIVMKEVLLLTAIGLLVGIPASLALGKFVQGLLFELKAEDPAVLALAAGVIVGVSLAAGYLPARRASAVDPVQALRVE
jgi:hypothetical protein